jgi:hypothetical protein
MILFCERNHMTIAFMADMAYMESTAHCVRGMRSGILVLTDCPGFSNGEKRTWNQGIWN